MAESLSARFNGLPLFPASVYMSCYFWRTTRARDVTHASNVPCRHPRRHVFARITSKPPSASDQPMSHRKQKHNIRPKAAILSGSLTFAHPASSPQVIENKNTIGMSDLREAQNQGKYP
jgi:hypothetical protein